MSRSSPTTTFSAAGLSQDVLFTISSLFLAPSVTPSIAARVEVNSVFSAFRRRTGLLASASFVGPLIDLESLSAEGKHLGSKTAFALKTAVFIQGVEDFLFAPHLYPSPSLQL